MRLATCIMIELAFSVLPVAVRASPCGNEIVAFEKYLDRVDALTPGSQTISGGVRINKAKLILDDAKAADQRGDSESCGSIVKDAKREIGSQ
jgi:hypothetical protein